MMSSHNNISTKQLKKIVKFLSPKNLQPFQLLFNYKKPIIKL